MREFSEFEFSEFIDSGPRERGKAWAQTHLWGWGVLRAPGGPASQRLACQSHANPRVGAGGPRSPRQWLPVERPPGLLSALPRGSGPAQCAACPPVGGGAPLHVVTQGPALEAAPSCTGLSTVRPPRQGTGEAALCLSTFLWPKQSHGPAYRKGAKECVGSWSVWWHHCPSPRAGGDLRGSGAGNQRPCGGAQGAGGEC